MRAYPIKTRLTPKTRKQGRSIGHTRLAVRKRVAFSMSHPNRAERLVTGYRDRLRKKYRLSRCQ